MALSFVNQQNEVDQCHILLLSSNSVSLLPIIGFISLFCDRQFLFVVVILGPMHVNTRVPKGRLQLFFSLWEFSFMRCYKELFEHTWINILFL